MNKTVIDANILVALIDEKDKWHSKAKAIAKVLEERKWEVIYLDCVMNEVISVLGRRLEERKESNKFESILKGLEKLVPEEDIEGLYPEVPTIYSEIIQLTKEKQGKLSFHDALITLFIKNSRLKYITSFDTDFDEITWCERIKNEKDIQ